MTKEIKDWQPMTTAPLNVVVWTKIDDEHGERNVQKLKGYQREPGKTRTLWLTPDGGMYVYYTPTHWARV